MWNFPRGHRSVVSSTSNTQHWMSCNTFYGPYNQRALDFRRFFLSIVLDADADKYFSGIRLIIVHEEDEYFDAFWITEVHPSATAGSASHLRAALRQRQKNARKRRRLVEEGFNSKNTSPLCTIVIEVVADPSPAYPGACYLAVRPRYIWARPVCVAFECVVFPDDVSGCLALDLRSSNLITDIVIPGSRPYATEDENRACEIRILPAIRGKRSSFGTRLPKDILKRVAEHLLDTPNHAKTLRLMGFVCKRWSDDVFNVYFEYMLWYQPRKFIPDRWYLITQALASRPDRGRLVKSYYFSIVTGDRWERRETRKAIRIIPSVRRIYMDCYFFSINPSLVNAFAKLRDVEIFSYQGERQMPISIWIPKLDDICRLAISWPKLRILSVCNWMTATTGFASRIAKMPSILSAIKGHKHILRLEELTLAHGVIVRSEELLRFLPKTGSYLRIIDFSYLDIEHTAFRDFLNQVAPTLQHITLAHVTEAHRGNDDHALDIAVFRMRSLTTAHIDGDLISDQFIGSKPPSEKPGEVCRVVTQNTPDVNPLGLPNALRRTGWNSITCYGLNLFMLDFLLPDVSFVAQVRNLEVRLL